MILLRAHSCLENLHVFWKDSRVLLFFSAVMLYLNSSIYSKLRHCKLISIFLKVTKTSTIEILGELLNYWIVLLVLRVFLEVAKHRFTSSISQVIFTLFAFWWRRDSLDDLVGNHYVMKSHILFSLGRCFITP